MINIPNMLLIGATDRNVGKTAFACEIIKKFSYNYPVIGLKITVIKENNGMCPRGGKGCGVCSSLKGNYQVTEEKVSSSKKDTSKMLAAGAMKVYWLRVLSEFMEEGANALFDYIGRDIIKNTAFVCESNSIRQVIEPGLFVVFKRKADNYVKPSCNNVIKYADKIVSFNPVDFKFSFDISNILFDEKGWSI